MTIVCDDDGKFQIIHWPPLPIEDSVAILQLLEVKQSKGSDILINISIFRNQGLQSRKFSIEHCLHDVNVDLKFVIRLLKLILRKYLF